MGEDVVKVVRGNLTLTRRAGEAFLVGDSVRVLVLECRQGRVRLVVQAPRDVVVMREELTRNREGNGDGTESNGVRGDD